MRENSRHSCRQNGQCRLPLPWLPRRFRIQAKERCSQERSVWPCSLPSKVYFISFFNLTYWHFISPKAWFDKETNQYIGGPTIIGEVTTSGRVTFPAADSSPLAIISICLKGMSQMSQTLLCRYSSQKSSLHRIGVLPWRWNGGCMAWQIGQSHCPVDQVRWNFLNFFDTTCQ